MAYVPCRYCDETLVQRGHRDGKAAYHDRCRPESRREIQREIDRRRWERMPEAERDRLLAKAREADDERQAGARMACLVPAVALVLAI